MYMGMLKNATFVVEKLGCALYVGIYGIYNALCAKLWTVLVPFWRRV